jgi:phosphoglycerate kinase
MRPVKAGLSVKFIRAIISIAFIVNSLAPVKLYADISVTNSLRRPSAFKDTPVREQLKVDLENTNGAQPGEGAAAVLPASLDTVKTRVAINNPGAQERELIRRWLQGKSRDIDLVGVNGISAKNLYYLLTRDDFLSIDFKDWFAENFIDLPDGIGDKSKKNKLILPVSEIIDANELPWKKLNAQVVIEGENAGLASAHQKQGAQSVIVTNPALTAVSTLMPVLSVFPQDSIRSLNFRDIQPPSSLQRGLDNSGPDPVLMRAMGPNIAPALRKDVQVYSQKLLPQLAKKIRGKIFFAPHPSGAALDIDIVLNDRTDAATINKLFKDAAEGALKGKLSYSEDKSLVTGDTYQQPQLIFIAPNTKVIGGRMVHISILHNELAAFAATQLPLLLQALKEKKAPDVITAKDSVTIAADAAKISDWVQEEQAKAGAKPAFLNVDLKYMLSLDRQLRPKIELPDKRKMEPAIVGVNGPGRTGRSAIWAMQGEPNVDLRMINGASNILGLAWLLSEDSIQQSTPKPVVRVIMTPEQLQKEAALLLANYSPEQVKGLLNGLLSSGKLAVLKQNEEFIPYLEKLLTFWGKSRDQLKPSIDWLLKSLVGVMDLNGKKLLVVNERKSVSELPWDEAGIKTILECTGDLKDADEARAHLARISGGRVIISAPAEKVGQSIVLGVVEPTRAAQIVDNASCTTNCLMPIVSVLNKAFGVISQDITTVHSYTTDQKFAQQTVHKKEPTRGRNALTNTLSASTGAAKTASVIIPSLAGNSDGMALRTPNLTGSNLDLTAILKGDLTKEQVQNVLKSASEKELAGIMAYTQAPLTSQLILGNPASSIVDGNSIEVVDYNEETDETTITLTAWYDNETGFSNRLVNLVVALQGFSMIKGKVVADIGPETVKAFEAKLNEINPATILWNGPMGVVEVAATSKGTTGVAKAIIASLAKYKITGGGDTLKTLFEEVRKKFTHVSTGGGAFLEAFEKGVDNLPGIKALLDSSPLDPSNKRLPTLDGLLRILEEKNKEGETVLVRVDFNVPLDSKLNVTDITRIKETLVTLKPLLDKKAKIILMSHLGRPNGKFDAKLKMDPVARELQKLLAGQTVVHKLDDCIGQQVKEFIDNKMKPGEIVILENTRFRMDEEQNSANFSASLSQLATYYVDDAFGTAHRAHASNVGVTSFFAPGYRFAGRLLEKEEQALKKVCENPEEPMVVFLAGGKVTDKIPFINALKNKAAAFLIGGRMSLAFLVAQGKKVGDSTPDAKDVDTARKLLADPQLKDKIILPVDGVVVSDISTGADAEVVKGDVQPSDMSAFQEQFLAYLKSYLPSMTAEGKARAAEAAFKAQAEAEAAPVAAPVVRPALLKLNPPELKKAVQSLGGTAYRATSNGYGEFLNTVKESVKNGGTIVVGAGSIFQNASSIPALKMLKDTGAYDVVVWAQDKAAAEALKAMGVDETVARVIVAEEAGKRVGLEEVMDTLGKPVVFIASFLENWNMDLVKIQRSGVFVETIGTPDADGAGQINSMPLVISRAVAILAKDDRVSSSFKELSGRYWSKVSEEDLARLNDLSKDISSVPLVQLNLTAEKDKAALEAETAYKEVADNL